jgi:hypothetical protein
MLQLPQRLGLDLPDTFARHGERLADFFQRGSVSTPNHMRNHALLRRHLRQFASRRHLAPKPLWGNIEAIRPGRRAEL